MFVHSDGSVTGSVNWAQLADLVNDKSDESVTAEGYSNLEALLNEHNEANAAAAAPGEAPEGESTEEGESAPAKNDNKAAWVDYAVAQGVDADEAEGLTKADLVERFGAESKEA